MTTLDQLLYGIRKIESGGNYHVVNSIGAVGAYQVMKANIPGWTKSALGHSMTWQQFRDSPSAQDAVARKILGGYYKKYGAEGAASMWFSGQPNPNSKASDGGNTVRQYVNKVIGASGGGSVSSSSKSSSSGSGGSVTPMSSKELAEQYGFVQTLFDSNAELKALFNKAVKGQWTAEKFQASLRDTKWFKTRSDKERTYLTKMYGDPATAKQDMNDAYIKVRQLANQIGMVETPALLKKMKDWAYGSVALGWDESRLRYEMGKSVSFAGDIHQGQGGQEIDALQSYAYDMGVKMSDSFYTNGARNIIRGLATEQDFKDQIRRNAKALYSGWSKEIDGGKSVADLASPYMQSMANILELPSGSVNLFDPTMKKALQYKDPQTGANAVKPMWQFENELRSDNRWKSTKNAQDSLMQVAHQVLTDFGVKY